MRGDEPISDAADASDPESTEFPACAGMNRLKVVFEELNTIGWTEFPACAGMNRSRRVSVRA